jgi:hypothetical protein
MDNTIPEDSGNLSSYIPWAITVVVGALATVIAGLYGVNLRLMTSRIETLEKDVAKGKEHIDKLEEYRRECEIDRAALKKSCEHLEERVKDLQLHFTPGDTK